MTKEKKGKKRVLAPVLTAKDAAALKAKKLPVLEVYRNKSKRYQWRKIGSNGRVVAVSGQMFTKRRFAAVSARKEYRADRARLVHL